MPEVKNGDVTLYYEDEGSGSPVLLIHGHTLDRRLWDPVVPFLLDAGLRVLRFDLRGHGRSSRPDFGYHPSHHAADMAAVLDTAGVDPAVGVGHSIGGAVLLEAAVTMPQRLTGPRPGVAGHARSAVRTGLHGKPEGGRAGDPIRGRGDSHGGAVGAEPTLRALVFKAGCP